jgi:hypothetical protein
MLATAIAVRCRLVFGAVQKHVSALAYLMSNSTPA